MVYHVVGVFLRVEVYLQLIICTYFIPLSVKMCLILYVNVSICEECISGSMRYITSSYMATAFGSRPPWSSLHGLGEDSTASLNIRVLRPKIE